MTRLKTICRAVLAVLLTSTLIGTSNGVMAKDSGANREITDLKITDVVEGELLLDQAINGYGVDVTTSEGIVQLTGTVDHLLAKERATRLAETVKGVRSVSNQLTIRNAVDLSTWELRNEIERALLDDPATEAYEVHVTVDNAGDGKVTLTGSVDSWAEKDLAAKVAKGVKGVRELTNNLEINSRSERLDSELQKEIKAKLRWNALIDDGLIDVSVNNGTVKLSGVVGSAAEKRQAKQDAWVNGVAGVQDENLEVARWARDDDLIKDKYVHKTDKEIAEAIKDGLLYDPRTISFSITPEVHFGTVTLRGTVSNEKAKRAAGQVARNTVGVFNVDNRLKVRLDEPPSDLDVKEKIVAALLRSPYVERFEVSVSVIGGVAYLYGTVDSYIEKSQADDVVSRVSGVVAVHNYLEVENAFKPSLYDPYVDDWYTYDNTYLYDGYYSLKADSEIKESIEDELWWSPFVGSDDITVSVANGVATLTGEVGSLSEEDSAIENAYEGGAVTVINELTVDLYDE